MLSYDLYGSLLERIEQVKGAIEPVIGCTFEAHESEYYGEYYVCTTSDEDTVTIRSNLDPYDNKPIEPDFPDYKVLVFVDETNDPERIRSKLIDGSGRFVLLRHEEL